MITDIVFPENNEDEFIEIAEKLGYRKLIFVYNDQTKQNYEERVNKIKKAKLTIEIGSNCNIKNINKVASFSNCCIAEAKDDPRNLLENNRLDIILS